MPMIWSRINTRNTTMHTLNENSPATQALEDWENFSEGKEQPNSLPCR